MCGGHINAIQQRHVEIRFWLPDIQYNAKILPLFQTFQQCCIIHNRATAGIYQNSARLKATNQRLIGQMERFVCAVFKQRRMKGDHIRLLDQFIKGDKMAFITAIGARRIAEQRANPQCLETFLQTAAHVTDADNAHGAVLKRKAITLTQHQ